MVCYLDLFLFQQFSHCLLFIPIKMSFFVQNNNSTNNAQEFSKFLRTQDFINDTRQYGNYSKKLFYDEICQVLKSSETDQKSELKIVGLFQIILLDSYFKNCL